MGGRKRVRARYVRMPKAGTSIYSFTLFLPLAARSLHYCFSVYPPSFLLGPTCAIGALDGGFARQCHSPPRATSAGSQATRR